MFDSCANQTQSALDHHQSLARTLDTIKIYGKLSIYYSGHNEAANKPKREGNRKKGKENGDK